MDLEASGRHVLEVKMRNNEVLNKLWRNQDIVYDFHAEI